MRHLENKLLKMVTFSILVISLFGSVYWCNRTISSLETTSNKYSNRKRYDISQFLTEGLNRIWGCKSQVKKTYEKLWLNYLYESSNLSLCCFRVVSKMPFVDRCPLIKIVATWKKKKMFNTYKESVNPWK